MPDHAPTGGPANRLAAETSPYLLQHAHDPVDWFAWGAEALERAASLDRPIFLSIGYAACHWCHVMAHESFRDPATAAELNAGFVAIKVDREERPDLDALYMDAVQALTGPGRLADEPLPDPGRPAVLRRNLLPRGASPRPAGLPRGARGRQPHVARRPRGRAAARRLAWRRRWRPTSRSRRAAPVGPDAGQPASGGWRLDARWLPAAMAALEASFDPVERRLGRRPQVPAADAHRGPPHPHGGRAGRRARRSRWRAARWTPWPTAASTTSWAAASPATRPTRHWLVPHFEKMLYDNAQLARAYLHAWQLTGDARYRAVVERHAGLRRRASWPCPTVRSPPARMPTRRASKGPPTPGRPRR